MERGERRALGVACGAHMLHDGYTDLVWVALPIWQAEFGLNYAVVGLLRTIYSGTTLASLQIPAAAIAARIGAVPCFRRGPPWPACVTAWLASVRDLCC
jgi:FSR family fosmidomycin resistance protein-like MFS transporter